MIALEGLRFYAFHGIYENEQLNGQEYIVDIYAEPKLPYNGNDLLEDTINYESMAHIAEREMQEASKLIEHVCYRIFHKIESEFKLKYLKVRISKPNPPVSQKASRVFVEIEKQL